MTESAYAKAGVDIAAGDRAVELMKTHVAKATRPEVLGGLGGFAGLFDASMLKNYRRPVLAASTDGVGTKVAIAQAMGVYHTVGWDLVGMLIDDLVVCGAEPLLLTDYIACGKVYPERIADIVRGIAEACAANNCALVGGETAEHPGLMAPEDFDIAGATIGAVEADQLLGPERVRCGDVVLGVASSGLHSNGYSLARKVLFEQAKLGLDAQITDLDRSLGEELLEPTRVYAADMLAVLAQAEVHAMSHITGGGLANNLARVMPAGLSAALNRNSWQPGAIFQLIQRLGQVSQPDIEATLNMGVGMALIVAEQSAEAALSVLARRGLRSWVLGEIIAAAPGTPRVELHGSH